MVREQTQEADWSPLADTAEIPKLTDLSSIIEENTPESEDGAGSCYLENTCLKLCTGGVGGVWESKRLAVHQLTCTS